MRIKVSYVKYKMHTWKISAWLDRDEYNSLREQAHKNNMRTPKYVNKLLNYAMSNDSWLD
ncbi:MAG: hypothetical protein LUG54_04360 [Clostridiales bacterium]|nr:hypothetical protein [Clostridiales bacterium]